MFRVKVLGGLAVLIVAAGAMLNISAQTMPKKWDDKCLERAREQYVACIRDARGNMLAAQQCDKDKVAAEAQCKIK